MLTAGFGTRLQPLTFARAKPAIPVGGEPMIRRIVRWLASHGVTDVVLNLHYLPETITGILGDGSDLGVQVRYSWEQPHILGSAGGPRHALAIVGADTFFIVNGDTLTDVDLSSMAAAHGRSGALVTLAVAPNRQPDRYGGVRIDPAGRMLAGAVRRGSGEPSHHFLGVQIADANVFRPLTAGAPAQSIGGIYDELIGSRPGAVRGFVSEARFWDIGTAADYWTTSMTFMRAEGAGDSMLGRNARISASARVRRTIVWDEVEVGADATLDECIVTDGISVPPGSTYHRVMLVRPKGADSLLVTPLP